MIEQLTHRHVQVSAYQNAKNGKYYCGDSYYINATNDFFICVVADGLGSGEYAYESSKSVVEVAREYENENVATIMEECNKSLRLKRGAAVSILKVYYEEEKLEYSCIGNIRFFLYPPDEKLIYPLPVKGYMSGKPLKMKTYSYVYEAGTRFFIYSDGIEIPSVRNYLKGMLPPSLLMKLVKYHSNEGEDDVTIISGEFL
ncbi:PP2C family serine/threonine-protein phosphatase [Sutcliffiella cohnii]